MYNANDIIFYPWVLVLALSVTPHADPLPRNTAVNQFTPGEVPSTGWQLSGLRTTNSLPTGTSNIEPESVEVGSRPMST